MLRHKVYDIDDATYDEWLKVVSLGWCPSEMFLPDHGMMTGAKAVAVLESEQRSRSNDDAMRNDESRPDSESEGGHDAG